MDRYSELLSVIPDENRSMLAPMVKDMVHIEKQLDALRQLPMVEVNENNPSQQRVLPASKVYKELVQQYTNIVKVMCKVVGISSDSEEESPLRVYLKKVRDNG